MDEQAISFGPYRLLAAQRLLLEGDTPVRLGSRAFYTLAALVGRAGEVVGKEELIARVWPEIFVEESNLKIQVSALRRALGDGQAGHASCRKRQIVHPPPIYDRFTEGFATTALRAAKVLRDDLRELEKVGVT